MNFGPKKNHFLYILDGIGSQIASMIPLIIGVLIFSEKGNLYQMAIIGAMIVIVPLYRLIGYFFKTFQIDEEKLVIRSGVLKKKVEEIPIKTIISADITQNVMHQLFKVYKINVDNATSAKEVEGGTNLILKKEDADIVRALLLRKNKKSIEGETENEKLEEKNEEGFSINVSTNHIMFMGLLGTNIMIGFYIFPAIVIMIRLWEKIIMDISVNEEEVYELMYENFRDSGLIVAVVAVAAYLVFAIGYNVVTSLIKYYGFKIREKDDAIFIEYGLLNKKSHTLKKDKITGVRFNQQLFMKLFHRGTLEVLAIGYQGTDNSGMAQSLLFPIIKEEEINEFLKPLLPNYVMELDYEKPEKKAFPYFFINFWFISLIILIGASSYGYFIDLFNWGNWWFGIIGCFMFLWLFCITTIVLNYKNTGIAFNEKNICAQHGGLKRVRDIVSLEMIEYVKKKATKTKEKKNLANYEVGFHGGLLFNSFLLKNLNNDVFKRVSDKIPY